MKISIQLYILGVILAFLVAYFIMPLVTKLAFKLGAIDQPDARKVHDQPMPRLGGMAIYLAFMVVILATQKLDGPLIGILIGATVIFAAGVLDDIYQLSPWSKLAAQIVAAAIAIYFGVQVQVMTNPFDGVVQLGLLSIPLTLLWIIGVTNAVNLIDGLDGLAGGVSAIAAITIGVVALGGNQASMAYVALVLVGAIAGFLPHNFHPARTFMGDSGALFLGFVLSCLSISGLAKSAAIISIFVPVLILGIPIFDTLFAILRRVNNGTPIFTADKAHLHHRLLALGYSHQKSVIVIYIISAFLGGVAVLMTYVNNPQGTLILAVLLMLIVIGASRIGIVSPKPGPKPEKEKAERIYVDNHNITKGA